MTHFGTSAKYIEAQKKIALVPLKDFSLASVRTMYSTGSPLAPESFDYVYQCVKHDLCLSSISGGTDIVSCFALGAPTLPVWRGEIQCRGLGMDVDVFDENGHSIVGEKGELVCKSPFPAMPVGFWNDPDGAKYHAAYFERFPGVWCHGDWVELTEHDGLIIYGRSDATLNPGGVRIGTAEIYRQVEQLPEIVESLAIGQDWPPDDGADVRVVLFVKLQDGMTLDDDLVERIKAHIRANTTPRHVPAKVVQVTDIPRTKSGKIMELAVRNVVHGRDVHNLEALANPEALEQYRDRDELKALSLLAILAALGLEQWRAFDWRVSVERAFVNYARTLERKFNGGTYQHGDLRRDCGDNAAGIARRGRILARRRRALVARLAGEYDRPVFPDGIPALQPCDLGHRRRVAGGRSCRRPAACWARGAAVRPPTSEARKLPGSRSSAGWSMPTGRCLPCCSGLSCCPVPRAPSCIARRRCWRRSGRVPCPASSLRRSCSRAASSGVPARALLFLLDWIPVRLTALSFAVVGDFEDAVACWRTQASRWSQQDGGMAIGILLAAGGGALGVQLGGMLPTLTGDPDVRPELGMGDPVEPDVLPSAVGLVWRALVLWLLLILLLTLANLAP